MAQNLTQPPRESTDFVMQSTLQWEVTPAAARMSERVSGHQLVSARIRGRNFMKAFL
jgi:hypothetical protein